jgi:GxxExxY protein
MKMIEVDEIVGFEEPGDEVDRLAYAVIGAMIEVHRELGPGHPESIYERALCFELTARRIPFFCQRRYRVEYKGQEVGEGRLDLLVGDLLIVEIKACEELAPIHTSQVLSYLKATGKKLAILVNFNVRQLKNGIKRIARTN